MRPRAGIEPESPTAQPMMETLSSTGANEGAKKRPAEFRTPMARAVRLMNRT